MAVENEVEVENKVEVENEIQVEVKKETWHRDLTKANLNLNLNLKLNQTKFNWAVTQLKLNLVFKLKSD